MTIPAQAQTHMPLSRATLGPKTARRSWVGIDLQRALPLRRPQHVLEKILPPFHVRAVLLEDSELGNLHGFVVVITFALRLQQIHADRGRRVLILVACDPRHEQFGRLWSSGAGDDATGLRPGEVLLGILWIRRGEVLLRACGEAGEAQGTR